MLVCLGSKTKAHVRWKTRASIDRLHDNDMDLEDGYPSRVEVALLDSRDRLLLAPIILEVTGQEVNFRLLVGSDDTNRGVLSQHS